MRRLIGAVTGLMLLGGLAQADTLEDVRQDLGGLMGELQRLNAELSATSAGSTQLQGSLLDRVAAIEFQAQALTNTVEELEFRIQEVVKDGTNRVGDLDFRVCELDPNCDIGNLGVTPALGGGPEAQAEAPEVGAELTITEQKDFETARNMLAEGDAVSSVELLNSFTRTYPGGPLTQEAYFLLGQAHTEIGENKLAARAYLESYSHNADGRQAPDALFQLGLALHRLGQPFEGCLTLSEVQARFPDTAAADAASQAHGELTCE